MRGDIRNRLHWSTVKRIADDRRGATAAIFAIAMPVLVGMGALAVDVGLWTVQKRQAQGAADQAAFSAAIAASKTVGTDSERLAVASLEANAIAADMGFVANEASGVTITTTKLDSLNGNSGEFWVLARGFAPIR